MSAKDEAGVPKGAADPATSGASATHGGSASRTPHAPARPWLAMAVLAVLSLVVTVLVAQRALGEASDIVVRGEGDVLMSTVVGELVDEPLPPSTTALQAILSEHATSSGLRYVAVVDREGHPVAEAGESEIAGPPPRPGQPETVGRRVRVGGGLFPPRHAPHAPRMGGPMLLVLEFEPPVIAKLRGDLMRVSIVGVVAGAVLLAFAVAWSRSAARLAAIEARAAREQRLVALGSMSSVMAHELRNPLASLKGHAQLLAEDLEESPKQKAKADRVVKEAERLELLTSSLLDFVRDGPIERAAVTAEELVARATQDLDASRVKVDVGGAPDTLLVDAPRLARALHNLVDNALQATPDGGDVELTAAREGDAVLFTVRDHGKGIPPGAESQIFEPFHTTRVRGTGLGLAVARRVAEQHEGTLTGENHPEGGAVFRLRLPARGA